MNDHPYRPEPIVVERRSWWSQPLLATLAIMFLAYSVGYCHLLVRLNKLEHPALLTLEDPAFSTPPPPATPSLNWAMYVTSDGSCHLKGPHGHEYIFRDSVNPTDGSEFNVLGGRSLDGSTVGGVAVLHGGAIPYVLGGGGGGGGGGGFGAHTSSAGGGGGGTPVFLGEQP
jgi:hypothetical protein